MCEPAISLLWCWMFPNWPAGGDHEVDAALPCISCHIEFCWDPVGKSIDWVSDVWMCVYLFAHRCWPLQPYSHWPGCRLLTLDAGANANIYWCVQNDPENISHQTDVKRKIFLSRVTLHQSDRRRRNKVWDQVFVSVYACLSNKIFTFLMIFFFALWFLFCHL